MRTLPVVFLVVGLTMAEVVRSEVITVDVAAWAEVGTGETNGWTVGGIGIYADGGIKFSRESDFAMSPRFEDSVTQIVISVKSSGLDVVKKLMITPADPEGIAGYEASPTDSKYVSQAFSWSPSDRVRQFCLKESSGASGNWGVASLTVCTDRLGPPTGLREETLYRDAFVAGWTAAPKAVRHEVRFASVTHVPPRFETVAAWDFSSLTNTYGGTRTLDQLKVATPGLLDDLSGEKVCMQKYESGHLQIGMGEKLGCLVLPLPEISQTAEPLTGVLCAWKYPADGKPTMPIYSVAGGVTNDLATVELTNERAEYRFPIPEGIGAESVILSSATNGIALTDQNGRVRVESFAIVSGYVPGSVTTNGFSSIAAKTTGRMLKDLVPGEWVWSVRSFDAAGRDSPWSPFRVVVLDADRPRRPRLGFGLLIR